MKKIFVIAILLLYTTLTLSSQDIFWDREKVLASGTPGIFEIVSNKKMLGLVYADVGRYSQENKFFDIYFTYTEDLANWSQRRLLIKDAYTHNSLGVDFAAALDRRGNLYICYRQSPNRMVIASYKAEGNGQGTVLHQIESDYDIYLPVMMLDKMGGLNIVYSENSAFSSGAESEAEGSDEIYDNRLAFLKLNGSGTVKSSSIIGEELKSTLNPVIREQGNTLYLVYQAKSVSFGEAKIYGIFISSSTDGGKTWTTRAVVSDEDKNSQKPDAYFDGRLCHLVWEKEDENYINHIYYKQIELPSYASGEEILISNSISEAHHVDLIEVDDILSAFWYDSLRATFQNYFTQIIDYETTGMNALVSKPGRTTFKRAHLFREKPILCWLQESGKSTIYFLRTDYSVDAPSLQIKGAGRTNLFNKTELTLTWNKVNDTSGIKGYMVTVTDKKDEEISKDEIVLYHTITSKKVEIPYDGTWYGKIKAIDNAGNISREARITFNVDSTPPEAPRFIEPDYDEKGALTSNSPFISWEAPGEEIAAYEYVYRLYMTPQDAEKNLKLFESVQEQLSRRKRTLTTNNGFSLRELDNGLLVVGVAGYDRAGNRSDFSWKSFYLNDYTPRTYITKVDVRSLETGEQLFDIRGRGYSVGGRVSHIYIDRDRKAPYDYVLDSKSFSVLSDRRVRQNSPLELEEGKYYIGVRHPLRGTAFYNRPLVFESQWLFLAGEERGWQDYTLSLLSGKINATKVLLITILAIWIFIIAALLISAIRLGLRKRRVNRMLKELEKLRYDLSTFDYNSKKEESMKIKLSLTFKYTFTILLLVILIVSGVSSTLGYYALRNEKRNLANEIRERVALITTNYQTTINDIVTFEKGYIEAVDQTGIVAQQPNLSFSYFHTIWDGGSLPRFGEAEELIFKDEEDRDILAETEKGDYLIDKLYSDEFKKLIEGYKTEIPQDNITFFPPFDPDQLESHYIITAPLFTGTGSKMKYEGEIAIGYSFEKTLALLEEETRILIRTTLYVTAVAILVSIIGAIVLATSTIRPIKKMYHHLNVISETEDYEKLVGTENEKLNIHTGDEIAILAESINGMTHKLIEKAKADKQLLLGKEIQKKFIPLEPHETDAIDIYGFYEGAKGVSGDYFDFKKLDDEHYAFIICDVAGKAVPAALIMVQISTIFHAYFTNFKVTKQSLETVSVVTQINDTVAERGFQGRFAAILVVILNTRTGKALMTNAGYTQLLVYREHLQKCEWLKLNQNSGAAGVFPSFMLPNPYEQERMKVNKGDIIFLFTDGIEESRNGEVIITEEGDEQPEEFGLVRIKDNIDKSRVKKPEKIIKNLMVAEKKFRGDLEQYDDLTLLAVMRK